MRKLGACTYLQQILRLHQHVVVRRKRRVIRADEIRGECHKDWESRHDVHLAAFDHVDVAFVGVHGFVLGFGLVPICFRFLKKPSERYAIADCIISQKEYPRLEEQRTLSCYSLWISTINIYSHRRRIASTAKRS